MLQNCKSFQWRIQDLTLGGGVNFVNGGGGGQSASDFCI